MSELVITPPGGLQMATEEVFGLIDHVVRMRGQVDQAEGFLRSPGSSYRPEHYGMLLAEVSSLRDDVGWLGATLVDYTERVASQERWRTRLWESTRNHWVTMMTSLGTGFQPVSGEHPGSSLDDAAATLLASEGEYAPEVTVTAVGSQQRQPVAQGVAERIARIPEGSNPVRIERYLLDDGSWHTEVFVAGTRTWSLENTTDPFDLRSNLALVSGIPAAATLATEAAMRKAGVSRGDAVVFVGHSQGGAVAATLANSSRYDTKALITVGAPVGNQPSRGDYPALRIEHRDDLVVQLGGVSQPGGHTLIETESGATPGDVSEAHSRERYLATAMRIDQSAISGLAHWDEDLPRGQRGAVTWFDATQELNGAEGVDGRTDRSANWSH